MSDDRFTLIEYAGPERFAELEHDWRRLYADMPAPMPWHSYEAYTAYLAHLCPAPERFRCLALSDGERVRAILPIEERFERGVVGKGPGLRLRVWGAPLRVGWPTTDAIGPEDEAREALLPAAIAHLRAQPDRPAILDLGRMRSGSVLWHGLAGLGSGSCFVFPERGEYVVPTNVTEAEFVARLSKNTRRAIRSAMTKFEALPGAAYIRAAAGEERDAEYLKFLDVEGSGWKGAAGSAVNQDPDLVAFYADLIRLMSLDGHCEIHSMHAEGKCISAGIVVYTPGTYTVLKCGYDESYAHISPGRIRAHKTFLMACEDPAVSLVSEVADAPWLRHWRPETLGICRAYVSLRPVSGGVILPLLRFWYGPLRTSVRTLRSWTRRGGATGPGSEAV